MTVTHTDEEERVLYPVPDTCRALGGIGRATLYELVDRKEITPVKIGRRTFFTRGEIHRYVASLGGVMVDA